jgi:hypothetical protein
MMVDRTPAALRPLVGVLLAALGVQLLLGMWVNLWVNIPAGHAGANAHNYFSGVVQVIAWALGHGAVMLQLHVALGLLLIAGSVVALVLAAGRASRAWVWATVLGFTGIQGAAFNGASFLVFGQDFSSYIMTAAFVIAAASYVMGLLAAR